MYVQSLGIRSFDAPITRVLIVFIENTHFADFSRISFWRKDELRYQNFFKNIYISAKVNTQNKPIFIISWLSFWSFLYGKKTIWKKPELWGHFDMIKRKNYFELFVKNVRVN